MRGENAFMSFGNCTIIGAHNCSLVPISLVSGNGSGDLARLEAATERVHRWAGRVERAGPAPGDNLPCRFRKAATRFWYLSLLVILGLLGGGALLRDLLIQECRSLEEELKRK